MSWNPLLDPDVPIGDAVDAIETVVFPRASDLGGFEVRRALPSAQRQIVGPFVFFDQFGPVEFMTGHGLDVRPHPHIGLATITWLQQGTIMHRDSLGNAVEIQPGQVSWMMAGSGICHSERTPAHRRGGGETLFGVQVWLTLPSEREDDPASFHHAAEVPILDGEGKRVRLIAGTGWGAHSTVPVLSETIYAEAQIKAGHALPLPDHEERAVYILSGEISVAGVVYGPGRMLVFRPGDHLGLRAVSDSRLMILGGAAMNGPRYMWWNFVASSREKIIAARDAWRDGAWMNDRFRIPPGDEDEFTPDEFTPDKG